MPNVMGVLRAEIRRLARKESRQEIGALKRQVASMRRRAAETKRRIRELERQAKHLAARSASRIASIAAGEIGKQVRFSPAWVRSHRKKVGMSRQLYARLVGVSAQTIMGWEAGRTRPRRSALQSWRAIRGKGVRELRALLGGPGRPRVTRAARRRGRRTGPARRKVVRARKRSTRGRRK